MSLKYMLSPLPSPPSAPGPGLGVAGVGLIAAALKQTQ